MNALSQTGSRVATAAFIVMVAGMIATPLFAQGGDERRWLAVVVAAALFVCGLAIAVHAHGRRAVLAAAGIVVFTFLVEVIGSTTGFPFGAYDYTDRLGPQLFDVPVVVSFAWAGITLVVHGALRGVRSGGAVSDWVIRLAVMAGAITAWDVFLDPQMVGEGYWVWQPASVAFRGFRSSIISAGCRPRASPLQLRWWCAVRRVGRHDCRSSCIRLLPCSRRLVSLRSSMISSWR